MLIIVKFLFCVLVGSVLMNYSSEAGDPPGEVLLQSLNQSYWDYLLTSHESILKVMKRHIRWMGSDTVAVTIVYQSREPVSARWFLGGDFDDDRWRSLSSTEVPHTIPVEGDSNCHLKSSRSGRVTAAILTIRRFRDRSLTRVHVLLTTAANTVQYQLRTDIRPRPTSSHWSTRESVDGPEWLLIPTPEIRVEPGSSLDLQCAVFVPNDNRSGSNELTMSRIPLTSDEFSDEKVMVMHKDTQDQTESINETLVIGRRYRSGSGSGGSGGHAVYHIGLSTRRVIAAAAFVGAYQCRNERSHDRLDVVFSVIRPPIVPLAPVVYLVSCNERDYRQGPAGRVLTMTAGVATCFRCRAAGRPTPKVAVYRNEDELVGRAGVGVTKFVSVVDAWMAEATYTYHSPIPRVDDGMYACQASNSARPPISIKFRIEVKLR